MGRTKKITVEIPVDVLKRAQKRSGEGVTATVRTALTDYGGDDWYEKLLALRGKVTFTESLESIREDLD
jgi:hypothetical protein